MTRHCTTHPHLACQVTRKTCLEKLSPCPTPHLFPINDKSFFYPERLQAHPVIRNMPELPPTLLCRGPDLAPRPNVVSQWLRDSCKIHSQGIVVRHCPCHHEREWCPRAKDRCMFDIKRHVTSSRNRRPVSLGGSRRCSQRSLVLGGDYAVGNRSCS